MPLKGQTRCWGTLERFNSLPNGIDLPPSSIM